MDQSIIASRTGVVVIGRNEGDRLKHCLNSVIKQCNTIVYVDSGSSDNSVQYAQSIGLDTIQLNIELPFSAARARNEGFKFLMAKTTAPDFVHFIDGDCVLLERWMELAEEYLSNNPSWAIVTGRLKELYPEKSVYNMLCDIEWSVPIGETESCGGIFTVRKEAFQEVRGFNPSMIAGEEPDLCYRLRERGWKIYRVGSLMAYHDANLTRLGQWWKRSVRSGYSYAYGFLLRNDVKNNPYITHCLRIWVWGLVFPFIIFFMLFWNKWSLLGFGIYLLQYLRLVSKAKNTNIGQKKAHLSSFFLIIMKWPQLWGQFLCVCDNIFKSVPELIEHK